MNRYFSARADKDYQEWRKSDKNTLKKINELIDDIEENGLNKGIGKPEQLKYFEIPTYSRRIDKANRLVYRQYNENELLIIACKGHYEE
jgi:toxin YoeB